MFFINKKIYLICFFSLLIIFSLFFISCGESGDSQDGIAEKEISLLTEAQVSNFIYVLPDVLDFSEKYRTLQTENEKTSAGQNEKFFNALGKSEKIKYSISLNHFKSMEEFISVYKNVVLAYTSIKTELTNYNSDFQNLSNKIYDYISNYSLQLKDNNLSRDERKKAEFALKGLHNDSKRLMNIAIVKKYETNIDGVEQSFQK